MTDHSLNLLSLNARGLSNFRKRRTIFTWCQKRNSENIRLSLQDVLVGMIRQNSPSAKLLNYLIMIGKLYLWDCRRSQILPNIYGFKKKIAVKYETEKYMSA